MNNTNHDKRYDEFTQFDTLSEYGDKSCNNTLSAPGILSGLKELIEGANPQEKQVHQVSPRWVPWSQGRVIHGRSINNGFFYFLEDDTAMDNKENPAAVIQSKPTTESFSTKNYADHFRDDSLGYWPSYSKLSVRCRGVYLDWLASTRSDPNTPLGYVFIYFSGLEYRIMIEGELVADGEFIDIYAEVVRLYNTYSSNYSFANFSARFACYLRALRPSITKKYDSEHTAQTADITSKNSSDIDLQVARKIRDSEAIDARLALSWLNKSGVYNITTPYERLKDEFELLFIATYNAEHPNGIDLQNNGSSLNMVYEPSNFAIARTAFPFDRLPNPATYTLQLRKLTGIADRCSKQLDAASRYMGRINASKNDLDFIALLPASVIGSQLSNKYAFISEIKNWAWRVITRDGGLSTTIDLWLRLRKSFGDASSTNEPVDSKAFQKDSRSMVVLLEALGYGVAPDKRIHDEDMNWGESVVLFSGRHTNDLFVSPAYYDAKSIISLAAAIAKSNADDNNDVDILKQIDVFATSAAIIECIYKNLDITEYEKIPLRAYALWRLTNSNTKIQLKPKKDHFRTIEQSQAADLVIEVAFTDNDFNKHRINKAQKVYTYLGGSKIGLPSIIHKLQTTGGISRHNTVGNNGLDLAKLKEYESETRNSAEILNNVFSDTEDAGNNNKPAELVDEVGDETRNSKESGVKEGSGVYNALDAEHRKLYEALIKKEVWSRSDVSALCQDLNLMLSGAIETINDWSFEHIDEAVIEEDEDIFIDVESVEELEKLN